MPILRAIVAGLTALMAFSGAVAQTVEVGRTPSDDVMAIAPGAVDAAVHQLPDIVSDIMERSGVPGMAVAVVHGGAVVFAEGFGYRELTTKAPVTPETVFQIASLSKPISTTVAAVAVARGEVDWNDPVREHLPWIELGDAYVTRHGTIGDFFAHRSGLPAAAGDDLEDLGFDRRTILSRLVLQPLDPFRISYNYANFGTTLAAESVAAAGGMEWEALADAYLFAPLGMDRTSYRHDDFLGRENAARLHGFRNGEFVALDTRDPDAQAPAGGVSSNVLDLSRWLRLVIGGGSFDGQALFAPGDILPALRPQVTSAPGPSLASRSGAYGYGFNLAATADGRMQFSHSGAFVIGAATAFQITPDLDLGIVVLSNGAPVGAVEAVVAEFYDRVQVGKASRDWFAAYNRVFDGLHAPVGDLAGASRPVDPRDPRPLDAYAGAYDSSYFGLARLTVENDGLVLQLGPGDLAYRLEHWDGDTFAVAPRSENAPFGSLSSVKFSSGDDGATTAMTIDYLNATGLAEWQR